jgi:hypothetical protein
VSGANSIAGGSKSRRGLMREIDGGRTGRGHASVSVGETPREPGFLVSRRPGVGGEILREGGSQGD